jgi:NitT/TauT family transport system substrate-binding protein
MRLDSIAAAAALLLASGTAGAQTTDVKFALDWALQGNHAMWTMAADKGHFAKENLNVTMDRGFGSGDTVVKVASGAYDIGFGDINALVPFNAQNPDRRVKAVFVVFDQSLSAVITYRNAGVVEPKDLAGKTLAAPEGEASRLMFPAFARANGVDASKVSWQAVTPQLRETMLAQKRVDGITGFVSTSVFNLRAAGVDPNSLLVMRYNDRGVDILGNAILVTDAYLQRNPKVVEAFIRATIAGMKDLIADPAAGMAQLKKRDPLLNEALELERWGMVRDLVVLTPHVRANGFSEIAPARLEAAVRTVGEAYNVADKVKGADVYTAAHLPPQAQRRP